MMWIKMGGQGIMGLIFLMTMAMLQNTEIEEQNLMGYQNFNLINSSRSLWLPIFNFHF